MLIGLMSDTHNDVDFILKAIDIFKEKNIKILVHAGDITSFRMLDYLKDFDCYIVLGNGDEIDSEDINTRAASLNIRPVKSSIEFECSGKLFLVFHGHNVPQFRAAVASGRYDYIIKGHTHNFENYVSNDCRIINPGAVYAHDESSVAILDIEADKVEKIILNDI
ncbi:MAG: metallophosphatase family protein [Spirochaetes bacterium]|nr:metallophosphatase family protein [Spirochaetota bacterium]